MKVMNMIGYINIGMCKSVGMIGGKTSSLLTKMKKSRHN